MNRNILHLAIPNIISNVTILLLGLADLALMGHLGSEIYIGAVSLGTVIFNFIYWGFSFLRMGTSGFTAQAYGWKKQDKCFHLLVRALMVSGTISILLILLRAPIEFFSFKLINGSQEVETLAAEYVRIRIWAAPATLGLFVLNGWFLGMQNAKYPMITSILANVFNMGLSILFVLVFEMKSAGVALGTVLAQYLGIAVGAFLLLKKYKGLFHHFNLKAVIQTRELKSFFKLNSDILIRTFCVIAVFTFFTSRSASINDHILAVNSILIQFLLLFALFIDGLAFAGEALAGRYIGEKDKVRFYQLTRLLFVWGSLLAGGFGVFYLFGSRQILKILTSQTELIETALDFRWWVVLTPVFTFISFIWDGIYIGATASKEMRNTMLVATFLVFAPAYFLLQDQLGNHALWLAMMLFMLGRGVLQTILYPKIIRSGFSP